MFKTYTGTRLNRLTVRNDFSAESSTNNFGCVSRVSPLSANVLTVVLSGTVVQRKLTRVVDTR